jgi:hypothetical protein
MRYAHTNVKTHAANIDALPWGKSGDTEGEMKENAA